MAGDHTTVSLQQPKRGVTHTTTDSLPSKPLDLLSPDAFPNLPQSVIPNSSVADIGSRAVDSYEVRRKQVSRTRTTLNNPQPPLFNSDPDGNPEPSSKDANPELEQSDMSRSPPHSHGSSDSISHPNPNHSCDPHSPTDSPSSPVRTPIEDQPLTPTAMGMSGTNPNTQPQVRQNQGKPNNWAKLFTAQAPSRSLKLHHYPDLQVGKDAYIEFDESQLDDGVWNHSLIGHFLDGKMPLPLLRSTALSVWKDHGTFTVKQVGSCYLFEFQDEESKLKVLEGGPYFFSRRFLVLKEWKRMLVPTPNHPPTIPVWVKFHRLPFEFWTEVGFSKLASTIGKPIHVDEATAKKKRLDYARICIEVDAADELPNDVTIAVGTESVVVGIEYQWLPSNCQVCHVFGHSCQPKRDSNTPPLGEADWIRAGKGKRESSATMTSGNTPISHPHQPLNPPKAPLISTQIAPKPPVLLSQSVSVTPFRATPTPTNTLQQMYSTPNLVVVPNNSVLPITAPSLSSKGAVKVKGANLSRESASKMASSMLHKLYSNSFHVLEEEPTPDVEYHEVDSQLLEAAIPPDKDHYSEGINDLHVEDDADCQSPPSPVPNPIEFYPSDLSSSERSKKQQKKAKKIAKQRSSSSKGDLARQRSSSNTTH